MSGPLAPPLLEQFAEIAPRPDDPMNRQWQTLTGQALASIAEPGVQDALIGFTNTPVSTTLPAELLEHLRGQPTGTRLHRLAGSAILRGPLEKPVLVDRITPSITHSDLPNPEKAEALDLAAKAREVKLLALAAELARAGNNLRVDEQGVVQLPSGIHINLEPGQSAALLNPAMWKSKRQIKDRVYEVTVRDEAMGGDQTFILKEQKTSWHKSDVRADSPLGRTPINSSAAEIDVARALAAVQPPRFADINLSSEQPIGSARFPDGFQFAMFKAEAGLITDSARIPDSQRTETRLAQAILQHRGQFEAEYQEIAHTILTYTDIIIDNPFNSEVEVVGVLSYEAFVRAKAYHMLRLSEDLADIATTQAGYVNMDGMLHTEVAYRVSTDDRSVTLDAICMDFDRFQRISPQTAAKLRATTEETNRTNHANLRGGRSYGRHVDAGITETAALYALQEKYDLANFLTR